MCYDCEVGEEYRITFEKAHVYNRNDVVATKEIHCLILPES